MKKTVIAISGASNKGKSASITEIVQRVTLHFPSTVVDYKITAVDVKAIIQIGNVKIGVESQGDPGSRLGASLQEFIKEGCDIIICATRTRGETVELVNEMFSLYRFDIIWTSNYFSKEKYDPKNPVINHLFADHIIFLVQQVMNNII
jgi:cytidylate kinase